MKKFRTFTVVAVMALISSGMFNACQKEQEKVESVPNISDRIIKLSYDDVLEYSIPTELWNSISSLVERRLNDTEKTFAVFSPNGTRQSIRYGFVTKASNEAMFMHLTELYQIKSEGKCEPGVDKFDDLQSALDWAKQMSDEGCDITMFKFKDKDGGESYIVIWEPDPTKSLIYPNDVLNRSMHKDDFFIKSYMIRHRVGVLGEYAIFSIDENDENIIRYGFITEETHHELFLFLFEFGENPKIMNTEGCPGGCEDWLPSKDWGEIEKFVEREIAKGLTITITKKGDTYTAASWK